MATKNYTILEFQRIENVLIEAFKIVEERNSARKQLVDSAVRVAHDIRSPLVALDIVSNSISELTETQHKIIKNAVVRINDIANNLLTQYKNNPLYNQFQEKSDPNITPQLVSKLLDLIISEKKLQYKDKFIEFGLEIAEETQKTFVKINTINFERVISNLINNSVEAIVDSGMILVKTQKENNTLLVNIIDTGIGMKQETLEKIYNGGVSIGKKNGVGVGISSAIICFKEWGCSYEIKSTPDKGTQFIIKLPITFPPSWFQQQLFLTTNMDIVILDDDKSIHNIWLDIFLQIPRFKEYNITIVNLYADKELINYHKSKSNKKILHLIDYQLPGSINNGIELITNLEIGLNSTLVTSYYDNSLLQEKCNKIGVKILPKQLTSTTSIKMVTQQPELVFIDDDKDLTASWQERATQLGRHIVTFNDLNNFTEALHCYDFETPIYIDSNLNDNISGEEYAKKLHELGYTNLYLCTGYEETQFPAMGWLKAVVGKNPPF